MRDLGVQCRVDGELRQDGRTAQLLHDVPSVIAWITSFMTLLPGDVVLTGTPAGVGPLTAGSTVDVVVEGIGTLSNPVVSRMTVRLRVAPSPTGDPHVGTAYMSLFNLAFVRQQGGQFVLRVEDTDRARFREDSEQQVYDTLRWLGLEWDEGPDRGGPYAPYRQSERLDTYRPHVERLLAEGHAYRCWCTTERLTAMREEQQRAQAADRLRPAVPRQDRRRSGPRCRATRPRRSCACWCPTTCR